MHAHHAARKYKSLVFVADETDVLIICLSLSSSIHSNIYVRHGTKSCLRLVDITKLSEALWSEVCAALPGLHSWIGCDTVSALANQGKMKALKIVQHNPKYRGAFSSLGDAWTLAPDVFKHIQEFTCQLYCRNTKIVEVNDVLHKERWHWIWTVPTLWGYSNAAHTPC